MSCRYCHEQDPQHDIIWPCACAQPVHRACLYEWHMKSADRTEYLFDCPHTFECEICQTEFKRPCQWSLFCISQSICLIVIALTLGSIFLGLPILLLLHFHTQRNASLLPALSILITIFIAVKLIIATRKCIGRGIDYLLMAHAPVVDLASLNRAGEGMPLVVHSE